MTRLTWSAITDRFFEAGLDHGVLYPKSGPAVPWNGLTSVDENGADSAAVFYYDGRPFLALPRAKEYTATLKAYTFPEEFSAIMGVTEATPGMYLDSQQADSFNLSYRTMVGNAAEGIEAGYKIHLIYNASVAPQGNSYGTLSNSTDPTEFSWEIQAIPVPVEGYRATAHVIIDTRNMDPDKLAALEVILYGDSTHAAQMPSPQVIFDTITYGDTIIITDNGDGTWTAEGSYANIIMLGDGVFEIDNVNATPTGPGSYDISSTP